MVWHVGQQPAFYAAVTALHFARGWKASKASRRKAVGPLSPVHLAAQAEAVRCLFGTLHFRPATVHPSWFSSLARTMCETRDFTAMPILADALEEAACDNPEILAHCRGPGPHFRGCWVVDLMLGKG
jgi:hypothetical protein